MADMIIDLRDQVLARIRKASADGRPIEVARGPGYDKRLKTALGLPGQHQSKLCAVLNQLIDQGEVKLQQTGEQFAGYVSHEARYYPVVRLETSL